MESNYEVVDNESSYFANRKDKIKKRKNVKSNHENFGS